MPQIINTNIASLNAQRNLNASQADQQTALQRLSSGLRINSAKDDAAGLAISTRFDTQVRGLNVSMRNANDGVSLAQVAEGSLGAISENLQRIRELALQSANDTNSGLDRQALDAEVQQLLEEIDSVTKGSDFNGRKLLDGSFTDATFQTGAKVGDTISFGIAETSVNTLGTATENGISSFRTTAANLVAGDLVINGAAVGSSLASFDNASISGQDQSSIAKAAAINAVSELSGVTATVDANTVGGTNGIADGAVSVSINGVAISLTISGNSDTARSAQVAAAINQVAGITGVRAEAAPDPDGGVNLIADDGRNIVLVDNGNLATSGLAGASTYTGTFTLLSKDGTPIDITSNTGEIANAGLPVGTYSGNNSGVVNAEMSDTNVVAEGDIVINGVGIGAVNASFDNTSTALPDRSAIALSEAINRVADSTGVTATPNEARVNSGNITAAGAMSMTLNNVSINVAEQNDVASQVQGIVAAVNAVSGQTGIKAEVLDGNSYTLIAEDGRNIDVAGSTANMQLTNQVTQASVTLTSAGEIDISTNTGNIANSGFSVGIYGGAAEGTRLADLDIKSVEAAEEAIIAIDNALQSINVQRATLGAIQNRFESSIASQAIARENLSAANSRIKDADFAAESAELSRSQVLQQAGISILGQANALPQQVLSLLQG